MLLPGPEAQQLATYIGWLMHRTWGGIVAGGAVRAAVAVHPHRLSWVYMAFGHVPAVAGVFYGIKPAVTAIVLHAAWRIGGRALKNRWLWAIAIAAAAFLAISALEAPFPSHRGRLLPLIGYFGCARCTPHAFAAPAAPAATAGAPAPP